MSEQPMEHSWLEFPEGYRYVWEPDEQWSTAPEHISGKLCRQKNCRRPASAALNRGQHRAANGFERTSSWWAYCDDPEHLYGRRIVDGVVLGRRMLPA